MSEGVTKTELKRWVNMTPRELEQWADDQRHKLASGAAGRRTLRELPALLRKRGRSWTDDDRAFAARVRAFVQRHMRQRALFGAEVAQSGYSKRHIAMRNWGHDVAKSSSPLAFADANWLRRHRGAEERR